MSSHSIKQWLALACSPDIAKRAAKISAVVGTLLVMINHGDALLNADVDGGRILKMLLCFVVPYSVSSYVAVQTALANKAKS